MIRSHSAVSETSRILEEGTIVLFAQSLGEYAGGGGGIASGLASSAQNGARWLQLTLREDRSLWIGAALCLVMVLWFSRRR
jgi:hypothetical protein